MQEFTLALDHTAPEIAIPACQGDLRVLGWERAEARIEVRGSAGDVSTERQNGRIVITSRADMTVHVPAAASLSVGTAQGDVRVQNIDGRVALDTVQGNLVLREVGPVRIGHVQGDLSAKSVAGTLQADSVQGDAAVRGIKGPLALGRVGGDLSAKALAAQGRAEDVQGDISLSTAFAPGAEYRFRAQGDVVCRLTPETSARLELRWRGDLRSTVPGLVLAPSGNAATAILGTGQATVVLEAGGDLILRPDEEWRGFDFAAGVRLEGLGVQVDVERIRRQAERMAEQIRRKAERDAEKARRQAERAAARAQRRAQGYARLGRWFTWSSAPPAAETAPDRADEPVGDEERLAILRMVENGQISAAEAAKLLEALGE